jgi:hypothetical protein
MRKAICVFSLLLLSSLGAFAQTTPKVEVFAGYSLQHARPEGALEGANSSGWDASVNYNLRSWLGVKADFSGYYCCLAQREHNILFGPQVTLRHEHHDIFFHALVGVSHGIGDNFPEDTVPAWAVGGGLDVRPFHSDRFSLRVAQLDYLGTHYAEFAQHHFRYSGGFVFRFGSK